MKKYLPIILISFLFLVACEKELDFDYHDIEPKLVIEGLMDQKSVWVTLSHTTPMEEKIEKIYLTDAEISLTDKENKRKIELNPDNDGIFTSDYNAITDNEYLLEVRREGKIYTAKCRLRKAPEILGLKFQWIKMPYDYVAVLQITFKDLGSPDDCYWLKIYRNQEPYRWIISDNRSAINGIINEVIMTTRKDLSEEDEKDILRDGDLVKVEINTISREMYDYLTAIQNDSNGPSLFEGDFCLGYFLASDSASDTIVFHPDEITQYE